MDKNRFSILFFVLMFLSIIIAQQDAAVDQNQKEKEPKKIEGCQILPINNIWNTPIDTLPVDANSDLYINTIGAGSYVHADFGSGLWAGGPIGIPYTTVPGTQEKVPVTFLYDDESDPGPYPIPPDAPIEGGSGSDGDRHVLVLDQDNCILYELYYAYPQPDGSWIAGSGAIFDLKSNALRPAGWTSADAAGLPILPGLVRYDEVAAGEINHAIRFTAPQTRKAYVWPARHYASSLTGSQYPPMGQRFRLKANFDISGFSPQVQVILKALKKYGMILADNGSSWFISGVPNKDWNNDILHELHNVKGSDFEAVDVSSLMISPNSGAALQSGLANTITVTSPNGGESWIRGSLYTITWTSTGSVGNVMIEYSTNNGSSWTTVVSSTTNDGAYSWTVPDTPSNSCKVRISETDGDPNDTSDSVFSIVFPITPGITVTSPNGGVSWMKGSTYSITWTSTGSVGNVTIELLKGGSAVLTVSSSTANDGKQNWTVPGGLSSGNNYQIKITQVSDGSVNDTGDFFAISDDSQPKISLNRTKLNAGAVVSGAATGSQTFLINNSGTGTLNWTITHDAGWLSVNPTSGTDSGVVTVSLNPAGLTVGTYSGTIIISDPNAVNSPQTVGVNLTAMKASQDQPPMGSFDTPIDGSTVMSSIPVTGWALDDIDVDSIKIFRREGSQSVYIGDAFFVEGARPDVENAYPGYPNHYKAGWGYMMLTNFLPGNGNGTFQLNAVAEDVTGNQVTLGTRTIICDNANAVKPFGAIDTPAQGGAALGSNFINWGWVLTPLPNAIPTDGSTIDVYVDGVKIGHPVYNNYRADIAELFPNYANSNGAVGYFYLDTTQYENGVHTIQWTATDDAGNTDGIGSRYFTILNTTGGSAQHKAQCSERVWGREQVCLFRDSIRDIPIYYSHPIQVRRGYNQQIKLKALSPDEKGMITIEIRELERLEIHLNDKCTGYLLVGNKLRRLPIGSFLDIKTGTFFWQPGPGFLGEYNMVFISRAEDETICRKLVKIKITPRF
jgi:flagellar hook assembly protein FlgD